MDNGFIAAQFGQVLPAFLQTRSVQIAVLLPASFSMVFWYCARKRPLPPLSGLIFLGGIALSVLFSVHRETDTEVSIHWFPGYALLLAFLPARFHPSWGQGYALAFASSLIADLWGAFSHSYAQGPVAEDFYYGIGGAGAQDALFLTPWIIAILLGASQWARGRGIAHHSMSQLLFIAVHRTRNRRQDLNP